jgi:hypothetical protein
MTPRPTKGRPSRLILGSVLVAAVLALTGCGLTGDSRSTAVGPPLTTFTSTLYHFSVSYDPKLFAVASQQNAWTSPAEIEFVAKPRLPSLPSDYRVPRPFYFVNCVYIDVSTTPPSHSWPAMTAKADVRAYEQELKRWDAQHRVTLGDLVGTRFEDDGTENGVNSNLIIWNLQRGNVYFHIQLDCPVHNWPVWGPRMLALVNSLTAGE